MIQRIVHMTFKEEALPSFMALFEQHRDDIAGQPGCHSLLLVQDVGDPSTISTISLWEDAESLDAYRKSALFGKVWPATKALFAAPPEAHSHTLLWAS